MSYDPNAPAVWAPLGALATGGGIPEDDSLEFVTRRDLREEQMRAANEAVTRWATETFFSGAQDLLDHEELCRENTSKYVQGLPADQRQALLMELHNRRVGTTLTGLFNHVADTTRKQVGQPRVLSPEEQLQEQIQRDHQERYAASRRPPK